MKDKVALLYIGEPRFKDLTLINHKKLINELEKKFDITLYDFTQPKLDRSECMLTSSGGIQVWDFYSSLENIKEQYIIKIRTDLFFTESSMSVVSSELMQIINGETNISFLGLGLLSENQEGSVYEKEYYIYPYAKTGKVLDWIVIVDRGKISNKELVINELTNGKSSRVASGNYTWKTIVLPRTNARIVSCHVALVRKQYNINEFTFKNIVLDMFSLSLPQSPGVINYFKEYQ